MRNKFLLLDVKYILTNLTLGSFIFGLLLYFLTLINTYRFNLEGYLKRFWKYFIFFKIHFVAIQKKKLIFNFFENQSNIYQISSLLINLS